MASGVSPTGAPSIVTDAQGSALTLTLPGATLSATGEAALGEAVRPAVASGGGTWPFDLDGSGALDGAGALVALAGAGASFARADAGGVLFARGGSERCAGARVLRGAGTVVFACDASDDFGPRFTTTAARGGFVTCQPIHPTSARPTIDSAMTAASRASKRRDADFRRRFFCLKTGRVKFERALPR